MDTPEQEDAMANVLDRLNAINGLKSTINDIGDELIPILESESDQVLKDTPTQGD